MSFGPDCQWRWWVEIDHSTPLLMQSLPHDPAAIFDARRFVNSEQITPSEPGGACLSTLKARVMSPRQVTDKQAPGKNKTKRKRRKRRVRQKRVGREGGRVEASFLPSVPWALQYQSIWGLIRVRACIVSPWETSRRLLKLKWKWSWMHKRIGTTIVWRNRLVFLMHFPSLRGHPWPCLCPCRSQLCLMCLPVTADPHGLSALTHAATQQVLLESFWLLLSLSLSHFEKTWVNTLNNYSTFACSISK